MFVLQWREAILHKLVARSQTSQYFTLDSPLCQLNNASQWNSVPCEQTAFFRPRCCTKFYSYFNTVRTCTCKPLIGPCYITITNLMVFEHKLLVLRPVSLLRFLLQLPICWSIPRFIFEWSLTRGIHDITRSTSVPRRNLRGANLRRGVLAPM